MRYLTLAEVLELHRLLIDQSGGAEGLRDLGGFEAALAQPRMTFDEKELDPTIEEKGTDLCFSLNNNQPTLGDSREIEYRGRTQLFEQLRYRQR